MACGHRDAELGEQFLGLIFVDVHLWACPSRLSRLGGKGVAGRISMSGRA
jgi:hypothetical protein